MLDLGFLHDYLLRTLTFASQFRWTPYRARLPIRNHATAFARALVFAIAAIRGAQGQALLEVRARTSLRLHTLCDKAADSCTIAGDLRDELGAPLVAQPLQTHIEREGGSDKPVRLLVENCLTEQFNSDVSAATSDTTHTDASGQFCMRLRGLSQIQRQLKVAYPGTDAAEPASQTIALEHARTQTEIVWLNRNLRIDVGQPQIGITVRLSASNHAVAQKKLSLMVDGEPSPMEQLTDGSGNVQFNIRQQNLGHAGPGRLSVAFEGDEAFEPARETWSFARTCKVRLAPSISPLNFEMGEFVEISVHAHTACLEQPMGIVELSSSSGRTDSVPLVAGRATARVAVGAGITSIELRYIPPSGYWTGEGTLRLAAQTRARNHRAWLFWVISSCGIFIWIASRWRLLNRKAAGDRAAPLVVELPAQSLTHAPMDGGYQGWRGHIYDAHTMRPVSNANVRIVRKGFAVHMTEFATQSSLVGHFEVPPLPRHESAYMLVEARHYSRGEWPLPAAGELTVRIQSVRRALLARFVTWVQDSTRERAQGMEPTPHQLASGHLGRQPQEVAQWAVEVQQAAFGPIQPDEDVLDKLSDPSFRRSAGRSAD